VIGTINLRTRENENRGFWLGLPWQGQGLMSEACEVVTDFWFDTLKFPVLRAPKAVVNCASRRISEKQGMRIVATEDRDYVSGRLLKPRGTWLLLVRWLRCRAGQGNLLVPAGNAMKLDHSTL
jgi:[ribosomal protein S5]-alanine N-acetyltransferase